MQMKILLKANIIGKSINETKKVSLRFFYHLLKYEIDRPFNL